MERRGKGRGRGRGRGAKRGRGEKSGTESTNTSTQPDEKATTTTTNEGRRGRGKKRNQGRTQEKKTSSENSELFQNKNIAISCNEQGNDLKDFITDNGGKVLQIVNKQTTFLVCSKAELEDRKAKAAKKNGVPIVNESYLYDFIISLGRIDVNQYPVIDQSPLPSLSKLYEPSSNPCTVLCEKYEELTDTIEFFTKIRPNRRTVSLQATPKAIKEFLQKKEDSNELDNVSNNEEDKEADNEANESNNESNNKSNNNSNNESKPSHSPETKQFVDLLKNLINNHQVELSSKLIAIDMINMLLDFNFIEIDKFLIECGILMDAIELYFNGNEKTQKSNVLHCAITRMIVSIFQLHHLVLTKFLLEKEELLDLITLHFDNEYLRPHLTTISNVINHIATTQLSFKSKTDMENWKLFCSDKLSPINANKESINFKTPKREAINNTGPNLSQEYDFLVSQYAQRKKTNQLM